MDPKAGAADPTRGTFHESLDHSICPLCGMDLSIHAVPQLPGATLSRSAHHFATECPNTRTFSEADPGRGSLVETGRGTHWKTVG